MIIVLIAGASASGKTKLSELVREKLKNLDIDCSCLGMDHYYNEIPEGIDFNEYKTNSNFDLPSFLDFALLFSHITALNKGNSINKPIFSFKTEKREGSVPIAPSDVLLIDGTSALLFAEQYLSDFNNIYRIFVEVDQSIVLQRRIKRDASERMYDIDSIIKKDEKIIRPTYLKFIEKTKETADIIVNNNEEYDGANQQHSLNEYASTIANTLREKLELLNNFRD